MTTKFLFVALLIVHTSAAGLYSQTLQEEVYHSSRKELSVRTTKRDSMLDDSPIATFPTSTNPPFITIPSTNPITTTPSPPSSNNNDNPVITNPANPGITNPISSNTPNNQLLSPPLTTNGPTNSNQRWCVAKSGISDTTLQAGLDYACGGGGDCSAIQQGGNCYDPNTLLNHASYAFNSLYQKSRGQVTCDFGGSAVLTNVDPSSGSCIFATSSSSTIPPTMPSPDMIVTTPSMNDPSSSGAPPMTTGVFVGSPPTMFNPVANPDHGGANTSAISMSKSLQAVNFLHFIVPMTMLFITKGVILNV